MTSYGVRGAVFSETAKKFSGLLLNMPAARPWTSIVIGSLGASVAPRPCATSEEIVKARAPQLLCSGDSLRFIRCTPLAPENLFEESDERTLGVFLSYPSKSFNALDLSIFRWLRHTLSWKVKYIIPKNKAQKQSRTIVFIDESGLSQKPHRCRNWAPCGETPVLEFNFNWQKLSVSAGVTLRNFYFRLYPGAIGELEVIDFLKALLRHIDGPLLIVWDRLPAHRSRLVREFIELSQGHIATEFLPPYAPELNPVEYIWAYWKQHELPNVCPKNYWELDERARKSLRRMRRKPRLITAFWKQSSLCLD